MSHELPASMWHPTTLNEFFLLDILAMIDQSIQISQKLDCGYLKIDGSVHDHIIKIRHVQLMCEVHIENGGCGANI